MDDSSTMDTYRTDGIAAETFARFQIVLSIRNDGTTEVSEEMTPL